MTSESSPGNWLPRVWAPLASKVTIEVGSASGSETRPLVRDTSADAEGWWHHAEPLAHGTDYAFHIDDSVALPDPRSAWQPAGVHSASRVFDSERHAWKDSSWTGRSALGAVIYELHIGTFTVAGTLGAAIERLDHLIELGVDMIELMPVNAFAGEHGWGYDGVGWYAVHEPYGGPAALQRFVDAAHQRGLAVCLDVVYNHLGPSGNYLAQFGPYFTDTHTTPWGPAVNLDAAHSAGVRAFIIDNACRWLRDFNLDALRLDAVHALVDDSPAHVLAELATAVEALSVSVGRPLSLIAESDLNDADMVTPLAAGGRGMHAQWADDVHHSVHALLTGERHGYYADFGSLDGLEKVLSGVFLHDGCWSSFRQQNWGAPVPDAIDGHRFVVFASDHDQIGNRALGDRPSASQTPGELAMAATLMLTLPYTPMLFMGEEWGASTPWQFFTDHQEPWLAEAIRKGRASEFGDHGWAELHGKSVIVPDPQAPSTLANSRLDWSELDGGTHRQLFDWYRTLIALRKSEPALASGDRASVIMERGTDDAWFIVHRAAVDGAGDDGYGVGGSDKDNGSYGGDGSVAPGAFSMVFTLSQDPCCISFGTSAQVPTLLTSWNPSATSIDAEESELTLPGRSVAILRWR